MVTMKYDPAKPPDPKKWLATDEQLRIAAMQAWAEEFYGEPDEDHALLIIPMLAVENQLASGNPPEASSTIKRLQAAGLQRLTALLAMAEVVEDSFAAAVDADPAIEDDHRTDLESGYAAIDPKLLTDLGDDEFLEEFLEEYDMEEESFEQFRNRVLEDVPDVDPALQPILDGFAERHKEQRVMGFAESAGFFFGLHACPELIMPSEWTELVQHDAKFKDEHESQSVMEARMALYNWVGDCFQRGVPALPSECSPSSDPMTDLEGGTDFALWCRGATIAHGWLDESWKDAIPPDSVDERTIGAAMMAFSFFIGREFAESAAEEMGLGPDHLESLAKTFRLGVLDSILDYMHVGLRHRHADTSAALPAAQAPVRNQKVGRNEPCPCGSGRKYKKCCGGPGARQYH